MAASAMNVQATFLSGEYSLIHFPRDLYSTWLHHVLRVLLPQTQTFQNSKTCDVGGAGGSGTPREWSDHGLEGLTEENQHTFLNVSVTPLECSVVCHKSWAENVFRPTIDRILPRDDRRRVFISQDTYNVISVISGDVDIVGRIMELTSPLALAGIPIFFISTYYSDFILAPSKSRGTVRQALADRGFALHAWEEDRFVATRHGFTTPTIAPVAVPSAETVSELFVRTFNLLKKRSVEPTVEEGLRLVQLSARDVQRNSGSGFAPRHGRNGSAGMTSSTYSNGSGGERGGAGGAHGSQPSWLDDVDTNFYAGVISALVAQPRFFSITIAVEDSPSLLMDRDLLPLFGDSLVGDAAVDLVPIALDLRNLPFEATGIVCGVAGKLVQEMKMEKPGLSYLSTACAGTVILSPEQSAQALQILRPLMSKEA